MIERLVDEYTPGDYIEDWDLDGLFDQLGRDLPESTSGPRTSNAERLDREELVAAARRGRAASSTTSARSELGEELMRALERYLLLQIIDQRWREHLYDMDYLREGIHLRGFAQIDPLVAYKNEAFTLFTDLMNTIWADFARMIFNVEVEIEDEDGGARPPPQRRSATGSSTARGRVTYSGGGRRPAERARGGRRRRGRVRRRWLRRRGRRRLRRRPSRSPSSSAASTSTSRSGATTRAGAGRARSTRSATGREMSSGAGAREYETLRYELDDHVVTLTYDRPEQHNAINRTMNAELHAAFERFRDDDEAFVLVITGAGETTFCAGWDLQDASEWTELGDYDALRRDLYNSPGECGYTRRADIFKPMIAAVNGYAFAAGLETAMLADIRIAAENARVRRDSSAAGTSSAATA